MIYIGIDNGTSGAVAVLAADGAVWHFGKTPTFAEQDYTKAKKTITRIASSQLRLLLLSAVPAGQEVRLLLERPMIMPARFAQSISAARAHEATLIAIKDAGLQVQMADSRKWQGEFLPSGAKGPELKVASRELGCRMWPQQADAIKKQGDADALFIAEYARRHQL